MFANRLALATRSLMTSAVRRGGDGGVPGANLPFQIQNRFRLSVVFILFFGVSVKIMATYMKRRAVTSSNKM
ncbi:hypothetical protein Pcinc_022869 [Petrolisthes cinctipes]|uniref:Cytochrome c oxidase polypeptide VIIc n=1 Tax=Petrolisthes cinctipes TaxID=88211 RepID=A0AAE1FGX8_PETCI|nr:hypothetical protein Pcinc_022869 [Petrolisthes cinctipes]